MSQRKPPTTPVMPSEPPGPAFQPCPCCGVPLHYRTWHHGTKEQGAWWEMLPALLTPALGEKHVCTLTNRGVDT